MTFSRSRLAFRSATDYAAERSSTRYDAVIGPGASRRSKQIGVFNVFGSVVQPEPHPAARLHRHLRSTGRRGCGGVDRYPGRQPDVYFDRRCPTGRR
jgi:hypothetical protein